MVTDSRVSQPRRKQILKGLKQTQGIPHIMGIINVTNDSFFEGSRALLAENAIQRGIEMWELGATWVDIGGESTRPGAEPVDEETESGRVVPVIQALRKANPQGLISVDTRHASVADKALLAGADMVNDVSGLRDPAMLETVVKWGSSVCIMHMQGEPGTMQKEPHYENCVEEVRDYLDKQSAQLTQLDHPREMIALDPGIGFGKNHEHNIALLDAGRAIASQPASTVLWGVSRKRIIGHLTHQEHADDRLYGTLGIAAIAALKGIDILRVHDVQAHIDLLAAMRPFL